MPCCSALAPHHGDCAERNCGFAAMLRYHARAREACGLLVRQEALEPHMERKDLHDECNAEQANARLGL
eukprot:9742187-Alexandrium_andersonii.AAC.1